MGHTCMFQFFGKSKYHYTNNSYMPHLFLAEFQIINHRTKDFFLNFKSSTTMQLSFMFLFMFNKL